MSDSSNIEFKMRWFLVFYLQRVLQFADGTQIRGSTEGTHETVQTVLGHFLNGPIKISENDIESAPLQRAGELYQRVWDSTLGKPFGVLLIGAPRGDMTLAELHDQFLITGARADEDKLLALGLDLGMLAPLIVGVFAMITKDPEDHARLPARQGVPNIIGPLS